MEHSMDHHHAMMIADFRKRFWVVLVLTAPVMVLSPMIQQWLGMHYAFTGSGYVLAGLASAGIVLVNSNPLDVVKLILFGRATYRKMMQNLAWATGYNVVAVNAGLLRVKGTN
ncbi:MAG TPA: hypothetical protein VGM89_12855 [Puia sp.]|jgi:cation transport ATPase